eukprot:304491_1
MAESSKNSERDLLRLGYSLMASIVIVLCIICALVVYLWKDRKKVHIQREMDVDVINMSSSVNASEMVDGNVRKVIDGKVVDVVLQKSTAESGIDINVRMVMQGSAKVTIGPSSEHIVEGVEIKENSSESSSDLWDQQGHSQPNTQTKDVIRSTS